MTDVAEVRKLPQASENAAAEAREQAEAYESIFAPRPLKLDNGETMMIPPHPEFGMLDDDRLADYEELLFLLDTQYDREDDMHVPEHEMKDSTTGKPTGVIVPARTIRGDLKKPYRRNGKLVKPPHSVQVVKVALGEVDYKRLREGGRSAGDVWRVWSQQSIEVAQRQAADSKSTSSTVDLASVSQADSE